MYKEYKADLAVCRSLQKKHGTYAYYFATLFLPREQREATFILYGFFRVGDQFVDDTKREQDVRGFRMWRKLWGKVKQGEEVTNPVMRATAHVMKKHNIPHDYIDSFLDAMEADISVHRYNTYEDLQTYMYGSANIVGLMMSHVLGYNEGALSYAEKLGEAMQYTNFLRDVHEDYHALGRVYIPEEIMKKHGATIEMIQRGHSSKEWQHLIKEESKHARALFAGANKGIPLLHTGKYGVRLASRLYESILDSIEQNNYDVITKRAKVPFIRKIIVAVQIYVTK